jgi:hypothetical protein
MLYILVTEKLSLNKLTSNPSYHIHLMKQCYLKGTNYSPLNDVILSILLWHPVLKLIQLSAVIADIWFWSVTKRVINSVLLLGMYDIKLHVFRMLWQ